jgi:hypothetical protein
VEIVSKQRINKEVHETLNRYNVRNNEYEYIEFIMERFFHYLISLLLHGIRCSVPKLFRFALVYTFYDIVPTALKKKLYFSNKAFGYSFSIDIESEKMKKYNYTFRIDKKILVRIAQHNESDNIYKLIKT